MDVKKLLETNYFINNEYFKLYIELIEQNKNTQKTKFETNLHHIIPRHYFQEKEMPIDDDSENTVNLAYKDHMLAHLYLSGCTSGRNRYWNLYAVFQMSGRYPGTLEEIILCREDYQRLYTEAIHAAANHRKGTKVSEETRNKMKAAQKALRELKGGINKGTIWVNDGVKDKMVPKESLNEYLDKGFTKGRLFRHSEEAKKKIAASSASIIRGEDFRRKMSEIAKKQVHTAEQNKRHSEGLKGRFTGEKNPFYGKTHTEESKQKNRENHLGRIGVMKDQDYRVIKQEELDYFLSLGYVKGRPGRTKKSK